MRLEPVCIALLCCLLLIGCGNGVESDLKKRFAERYETELCFVAHSGAFPFGANDRDQDTPWINALAVGGLLDRKEGAPPQGDAGTAVRGKRYLYDLTPEGRQAIRPGGRFCYGRTVVVEITGHTAPAMRSGVESLTAWAKIRHEVTKRWARHPDLLASGKIKAGEETIEAIFVKQGGRGWVFAE
jgi:hypothetical protein